MVNQFGVVVLAATSLALIVSVAIYQWKLHFLNRRLNTLIGLIPDAALWMNAATEITHASDSAAALMGLPASRLKGKKLSELLPDLDCQAITQKFWQVGCNRPLTPSWHETLATGLEDHSFPVRIRIARCNYGGREQYLLLIRDITHQCYAEDERNRHAEQLMLTKRALEKQNATLEDTVKHRTEELRLAKEAAESASSAKSVFLANVSHELRTPLHGILSFARLGRRRVDTSSREKLLGYFERVEQCGCTLLTLVNQLLDLARLEARDAELTPKPIDLNELIREVTSEFSALAEQQNIGIELDTTETALQMRVDRVRIGQVMRNLIGNALKFSTGDGTIQVAVQSQADSVTVCVADQGPGIPDSELQVIFDKFVQSSYTNSGAGGTGLGLAICHEIIESHGGVIWAENRDPHGALFAFRLARAPDRQTAGATGAREQHREAPGGRCDGSVQQTSESVLSTTSMTA